jgi:3-oxoacyl-[acyl-carrier protein] reductase
VREWVDFAGRRVMVTGGTQGIGNAIAMAFVEAGAEVIVSGTRAGAEAYDADLSRFTYVQAQMGDAAQRAALAEAAGDIDVLVNNAGGSVGDEYELANFTASIEINLNAVMDLSLRFHAGLAARQGAIVNIGSLASHLALKNLPGYTAAKSGMFGLTRALADRWAPDGVRVNMIAPGFIRTGITDHLREDPSRERRLLGSVPMRRWGRPEEIAGAALFLASPAASYVTGISLAVDGGVMVR